MFASLFFVWTNWDAFGSNVDTVVRLNKISINIWRKHFAISCGSRKWKHCYWDINANAMCVIVIYNNKSFLIPKDDKAAKPLRLITSLTGWRQCHVCTIVKYNKLILFLQKTAYNTIVRSSQWHVCAIARYNQLNLFL